MRYKLPLSVLVVVHTAALEVLLLERVKHPGFWQSVTGALDREDEPHLAAALRELREETGIEAASEGLRAWPIVNHFDILPQWRDRYAPGVTRNAERLFSLCLEDRVPIRIAAGEHRAHVWLPWREAAKQCFSWTNQDAIRMIALDRAE